MRVVIEASPALHNQAGIGRYTAGLLNGLLAIENAGGASSYALAYNCSRSTAVPPEWAALPRHTTSLGNKPWRMRAALTYFGAPKLDSFVPGADVYHSTGHLLPRFEQVRTVFTLHDLIPLIYPEYHLPLNRIFLKHMFPRFLRAADAIIAVSEHSRRDAQRLLGIDPADIIVIPEAVEPHLRPVTDALQLADLRQRLGLPERFVLCVCTIEPRKNHITLLRAWERIAAGWPDGALVIAGKPGWLYKEFFAQVEQSPVRERVILTGYVAEDDLATLLSAATVFAFPSLYEGFGLPPLEAMACGTPVVSANSSSLPEAVGDAGLLLPPDDVAAWADTLSALLRDDDRRAALRERGFARVAAFTWERAAEMTRAVYARVVS